MKTKKLSKPITVFILLVFFTLLGTSLFLSGKYINKRLLESNVNNAVDIALLMKNNFKITDAEVTYMKGLSFNEMEVDNINKRFIDVETMFIPLQELTTFILLHH